MAGDWIKMRVDLDKDPAVISTSTDLNVTECTVVGMLHRLWAWADAQSRNGHVAGVTKKWIDRYLCHDGVADALEKVGWLREEDGGITFPNFDRHNGQSAKKRAVDARRQREHRESKSRNMTRNERDKSVTREEKRREEKSFNASPPNSSLRLQIDKAQERAGLSVNAVRVAQILTNKLKNNGTTAEVESRLTSE
ncbi:hypothetical protein ABVN23_08450 [Pseudomonas fluorescens]|uniref:hypothetical protein n=1 Tax=Pseudomonas fluorescens TaxID=294 RepID=UPI003F975DCB